MNRCSYCGKEVDLPFRCNYCGNYFCSEHRLPPTHNCVNINAWMRRPPPKSADLILSGRPTISTQKEQVWSGKVRRSKFDGTSYKISRLLTAIKNNPELVVALLIFTPLTIFYVFRAVSSPNVLNIFNSIMLSLITASIMVYSYKKARK